MEERKWLPKQLARDGYNTIEFWFRRKYNLTRTDPRYLEATVDEMLEDFYLHTYFDDPKAVEATVEDDDFNVDAVADRLRERTPAPLELPDDFEDVK